MRFKTLSSSRFACLTGALFGVVYLSVAAPVLAQSNLGNSEKTALRNAMQSAQSGSWLQSPTIEQRQEAGLLFLRSEGYYGATIEDASTRDTPSPAIEDGVIVTLKDDAGNFLVRAGPRFTIGAARITIEGNRSIALNGLEEDVTRLSQALANQPARATNVLNLRGEILASAKSTGFVLAQDEEPDILIDHADSTMTITYKVISGPLIAMTNVQVSGASLTPKAWVMRTAAVTSGEVAKGERLKEISERFQLTGAYSTVDVALSPPQVPTADNGVADVVINLNERTKRTWSAGAAWSTSDGLGVDATTSFFHKLHRADTLMLDARLGTLESSLGASLRLPSLRAPSRDLFLEARAGQETTDAFDRFIARLGAIYVIPRGRRDTLTYRLGVDVTQTRIPAQNTISTFSSDLNGSDLTALIRYERDRSDDIINPTQGWRAQGEIQPAVFFGEDQTLPYGRLVVSGSIYRALRGLRDGVFAARLKGGYLLANSSELPFDRRFFAGGGGSVRGYAYQSIGPRDTNDNPLGGSTLLEGSVEARWSVRGPFGAAVFADVARVGSTDSGEGEDTKVGIGFGLRYNLGLAPLRVDFAFPLTKRKGDPPAQIYLSAGQSF